MISVKLGGNEERRPASVPLCDQKRMDKFDGADIEPARRLLGDQQRRLMSEFARNDKFLKVSAGKRFNRLPLAPDLDPESLDKARGRAPRRPCGR